MKKILLLTAALAASTPVFANQALVELFTRDYREFDIPELENYHKIEGQWKTHTQSRVGIITHTQRYQGDRREWHRSQGLRSRDARAQAEIDTNAYINEMMTDFITNHYVP